MSIPILHISDLHRDLNDEIGNTWLLDSIETDFKYFEKQSPRISLPELCIVTGDLIYGVQADGSVEELERQYAQAEEFLIGVADRFFKGDRERVVILPGNHDVNFIEVMNSLTKIEIPNEPEKKARLVSELFKPNSLLRWSWKELCFYKITDEACYRNRFQKFAEMYNRFYQNRRSFAQSPEDQYEIFDFPDLQFCVVALNSCYGNDPLHRSGALHPGSLTGACRELRHPSRTGWIGATAWHHNLSGGPEKDDYLDDQFLQLLIDAGASVGFHGHQHSPGCFDERSQLGLEARKITIISASTLCAEPRNLTPGIPRSYNIVELDTDKWVGRVHQRQMVNQIFNLPVWGPGHFIDTNTSYFEFDLCKPRVTRSQQLDVQLHLEQADRHVGSRKWNEAIEILIGIKDESLARAMLVRALSELGDARRTISVIWPPVTNAEVITIGGAILENGTKEEAQSFIELEIVSNNSDASVREIAQRIRERRLK